MPIAVEAMIQGTETPAFEVEVGRLRFSTTINGYQLIAPGESFPNPIKQMYAVFTYQPSNQGVPWTALWYQNGDLKYVDASSWTSSPPGVGVANWARDAVEWEAGAYEVQIFVGTDWKASGSFALTGEPPTFTPQATSTDTPKPAATSTLTATLPPSPTATGSPVPSATASSTPPPVTVEVFFSSAKPSPGSPAPADEAVTRQVSGSGNPIDGALAEYFKGPNDSEKGRGLTAVYNGFTGYRRAELLDGMLGVYLEGNCQPNGTSYSIAQPLIETLGQFPGVSAVKIYDEYDHTRDALSNADSWPTCLDAVFTSTATARPTMTSTATASAVPTDQKSPTPTETPIPSATPQPSASPTSTTTPSPTPKPTATPVPSATTTPLPTITATIATETPTPTATPAPGAPSIIDSILMFLRQLFGGR